MELSTYGTHMTTVALVRGQYIERSEILNYEPISKYDVTLIGASGTQYRGPLRYETFPSASMASSGFLQKGVAALSGQFFGAHTYLHGLTKALEEYDIIHVAETYHGFSQQAIEAKRRYGCKVVSTVWENIPYFLEDGHYSRGGKQKLAYSDADHIKTNVRDEADGFLAVTDQAVFALESEGVKPDKIFHIPMGVDTERFSPNKGIEASFNPKEYGFDENSLNVTFIGKSPWRKGVFDLLSAWKVVENRAQIPVRLSLIGAESNRERLRAFADHLDLSTVTIHGQVPYNEVPKVMDVADILVLPSLPTKYWQEQYGRVVPEAQACKTAIVASDTGGIPEAAGNIGEFIRPGDAQDLAKTLINLAHNETKRNQLAEEGQTRIAKNLTITDTARQVTEVYDKIS